MYRLSRRLSLGLLAILTVPAAFAISFSPARLLNNSISSPQKVQAVDMDLDGDLDIVAIDGNFYGTGGVVWWENLGKGNYRRAGELRDPDFSPVRLGNFDGDNVVDLLSSRYDSEDGRLHYYLSKGLGLAGFAQRGPELPFPTSTVQGALTFEDVDGDTYTDVLAGNQLWLGRPDGTFVQAPGTPLPEALANEGIYRIWADVNGDDQSDCIYISDQIYVSMNLGSAGFGPPEPFLDIQQMPLITGITPVYLPGVSMDVCLLVEEIDPTLASQDRFLSVVLKRDGVWQKAASLKTASGADARGYSFSLQHDQGYNRLLLERFDGSYDPAKPPLQRGKIYELTVKASRTGAISITSKPVTGLPDTATGLQFADLNGDGKNDALYHGAGQFWGSIQWQQGAAPMRFIRTIRPVAPLPSTGSLDFAGDLNGDGDVDVLAHMPGLSTIAIWTNNGHGSSFTQTPIFTRGTTSRVLKVLETGAKAKILVFDSTPPKKEGGLVKNELVLLTRMPNGKFSQKTLITESGTLWQALELIDGDLDGTPDLRVFDGGSPNQVGVNASHWYQGLAGLKFRKVAIQTAGNFPEQATARVDVDWDGDLDLWKTSLSGLDSWTETTGATRGDVHLGPGGHYFPEFNVTLGSVEPIDLDFDGDGHPDYVSDGSPVLARGLGDRTDAAYPLELNNATYALHLPVNGAGRYAGPPTFFDIDGDHDLDYLGPGSSNADSLELRINGGGVDYSSSVLTIDNGKVDPIDTGLYADLDGDGIPDVISMTRNFRLQWYKGSN